MNKGYFYIVALLVLSACSSLKSLQTVETKIPCLGSVGNVSKGMFFKNFDKVGEPHLSEAISVSLQSVAFTKSTFGAYKKYRENLGKSVDITFNDSLPNTPRYFQLELSDLVTLKETLNGEVNSGLKNYLESEDNLKLLTGISFVAIMAQEQMLQDAQSVQLKEIDGHLELHLDFGSRSNAISMKSLQVFDFETSGFCWNYNKRNQPEIVTIRNGTDGCPKGTENSASKLDETREYLKL